MVRDHWNPDGGLARHLHRSTHCGGNPWFAALYGLRSYLLPFPVAFIIGGKPRRSGLAQVCPLFNMDLAANDTHRAWPVLSPSGWFLNKGAYEGAEQITYVGARVRASGTFSFVMAHPVSPRWQQPSFSMGTSMKWWRRSGCFGRGRLHCFSLYQSLDPAPWFMSWVVLQCARQLDLLWRLATLSNAQVCSSASYHFVPYFASDNFFRSLG